MKVIKEIISYLNRQNLLTTGQLRELEALGFYSEQEELINKYSDYEYYWHDYYDDDEMDIGEKESLYDKDFQVNKRKSRKGGTLSKGILWSITAKRINEELGEWISVENEKLKGVLDIARKLSPEADVREAPLLIRNADDDEFFDAVSKSVENRTPSLNVIWETICMDDIKTLENFSIASAEGKAMKSYKWLFSSPTSDNLDNLGWLLKHKNIKWAYNYHQAQLKILRIFKKIYDEKRVLIDRNMRRDFNINAFLVFAVLYTVETNERKNHSRHLDIELEQPTKFLLAKLLEKVSIIDNNILVKLLKKATDSKIQLYVPKGWHRYDINIYNPKKKKPPPKHNYINGVCKRCGVSMHEEAYGGWDLCDK